ncbi:MAG: cytochrome c-type biogenesis protein CcmH [Acidimicrobiales bacterium]
MSTAGRSAFRTGSWIAIGLLALAALGVAAFDDGPPRTTEQRVEAIAKTLKCPVCDGQSVADSDSASSRAIRAEIARLVDEGQDGDQVRAEIGASFGDQVQLIPPASGFAGLVWILPVVVLIVAVALVGAALARWRRRTPSAPSDDDRALVEDALRQR